MSYQSLQRSENSFPVMPEADQFIHYEYRSSGHLSRPTIE